jgi:hypothetical protein
LRAQFRYERQNRIKQAAAEGTSAALRYPVVGGIDPVVGVLILLLVEATGYRARLARDGTQR